MEALVRPRRCVAHTTNGRSETCSISGQLLWISRNSALGRRSHWENDGPTAMAIHIVGNVEELGLVCGTEVLRASAADSDTRVKQNGEGRPQGKVTHNGRSDGEGTGTDGAKAQQERDTYGRNMEEHVREIGRRHGHSWCWRCCREGHKVAQCVVVVESSCDDQQKIITRLCSRIESTGHMGDTKPPDSARRRRVMKGKWIRLR